MNDDIKVEPDKNRLYGLLRAERTASPQEFMRAMSPETHDIGLGQADTLDNLFSHLGISTDRTRSLSKAATVEKSLLPLYNQYAEYNNKRIQAGATIGEARSLGSPVPPGSVSEGSMEVPRSVVPDTFNIDELQHPAADGQHNWATTGQSGYDSPGEGTRLIPTDTTDNQALLPPSYQSRFNATMHRAGLRGNFKEDRIASARERLHDIQVLGMPPDHPSEVSDLRVELGLAPKTYAADSAKGQIDTANAQIKQAQVPYAGKQAQANLQRTQAATESSLANTQTQNALRQARLNKLIAQSELAQKQAHLAGDLSASEIAKQRTLKFNMLKYGTASGMFDAGEQESIINSILEGTDLKATQEQPTGLRKFFGLEGNGVHVGPRDKPAQAVAPTGNPMQIPGGVIMPEHQGDLMNPEPVNPNGPGAQAEPMDKKAMAKALYDRMKEGDTQTFDGVKYKKQGSKLVRVQ